MRPKGIKPKGIKPKGIKPKGIKPKGIKPKGIKPKGIKKNALGKQQKALFWKTNTQRIEQSLFRNTKKWYNIITQKTEPFMKLNIQLLNQSEVLFAVALTAMIGVLLFYFFGITSSTVGNFAAVLVGVGTSVFGLRALRSVKELIVIVFLSGVAAAFARIAFEFISQGPL